MADATAVLEPIADSVRDFALGIEPTLTKVEVTLLGGFAVKVDGRTVSLSHWSRRHSAALVKLLALAPARRLHRERVIDALWPDLSLTEAAPRLHKAAHYARRALGYPSAVVLSADIVWLCPDDDVNVDTARFQLLAESAARNGGAAAAVSALAPYRGELLPHDMFEPWAEEPRQHLARLHRELLHQAEDWHQALLLDPADETAHLALARRYADNGDRPAALRQLDNLDRMMRQELGLPPSQHTRELRQHVLSGAGGTTSRVTGGSCPAISHLEKGVGAEPECCSSTDIRS
jgi:DNA-binding SARP family transcriptional activator